jgi:threonine dehydrogenase-like Zn-dependent dehydrogenase
MKRVVKLDGFGNMAIEEVEIPPITSREMLVKTKVTLISRGSEILVRYMMPHAVDPSIVGYSVAGVVDKIGDEATRFTVGQKVATTQPHAEYVVSDPEDTHRVSVLLPDEVSFESGTFMPLATSAVGWTLAANIQKGDSVVVLGQGLVGSLVMQAAKAYHPGKLIVVDALERRCHIAQKFDADHVINCAEEDPVKAVKNLTDGGADIVIDCVGGTPGIQSFEQAQQMVQAEGTIYLIAKYHGQQLSHDESKKMGNISPNVPRPQLAEQAVEMIRTGQFRVQEMVTHRFHFTQAKEAFDLLFDRLGETLGVILEWE